MKPKHVAYLSSVISIALFQHQSKWRGLSFQMGSYLIYITAITYQHCNSLCRALAIAPSHAMVPFTMNYKV